MLPLKFYHLLKKLFFELGLVASACYSRYLEDSSRMYDCTFKAIRQQSEYSRPGQLSKSLSQKVNRRLETWLSGRALVSYEHGPRISNV